jgi:hypothetical protein
MAQEQKATAVSFATPCFRAKRKQITGQNRLKICISEPDNPLIIYRIMFCFDCARLTRGDLELYINREVPISIDEITTQKEDVKAFPFIDSEALPVIRLMLEKMTREGLTKPDSRVLNYERERQLTRILQRLVSKAGIVTGNKQVRFHCMRKFLIDRLSSFMSESKWKQIVGKKISEGAYVSPDSLRADYSRAMAETCFLKQIGSEDMAKIAKKQALLALAKEHGYGRRTGCKPIP